MDIKYKLNIEFRTKMEYTTVGSLLFDFMCDLF